MTETVQDTPQPQDVVVICTTCMRPQPVPEGYPGLECRGCGGSFALYHCPQCRWPLMIPRFAPTMSCPGCRRQTSAPDRAAAPAPAREASYFQGLAAVAPASADIAVLPACTAVGAWGMPFQAGTGTLVSFAATDSELHLTPISLGGPPVVLRFAEVMTLGFEGPGRVTTGGQFIGGGFGLVGAAKGILAAEVLNRLTRKTTVNSFVTVEAGDRGAILHTAQQTPEQLRFAFAGAAARVSARTRMDAAAAPQASVRQALDPEDGIAGQLERLHALHREGALSDVEYERAKAKVLDF